MSAPAEVRVPDIGDFADVPVIEIHVSTGDEVAVEDPLVTLESDKATMDVPAPFAGVVKQLRVSIGDRVSEGSVLLVLEPDRAEARESDGAQAGASDAAVVQEPAPPPPSDDGAGERDAQVVVIGSGPGGYTAAFRAADLGLRTILVERFDTLGGVCLNVGCIPSKALLHAARVIGEVEEMAEHGIKFGAPEVDIEQLLAWKQSVVDKLTGGLKALAKQRKVEVVTGVARFTGPHTVQAGERAITFEHCIIAAGSQAARLPGQPDDGRIIDSTGALSPSSIPPRLLVIGGGIIGLEMATVYDALGSRVTVVELMDQLIPGCDPDLVRVLHKRISSRYEGIHLGTEVGSIKAQSDGVQVELSNGESQLYDQVLVAVGRKPNGLAIEAGAAGVEVDPRGFIAVDRHLRTNVPHIYAIGDIVGGPMLAHKASHEGKTAAEVIAGVAGAEFDPARDPRGRLYRSRGGVDGAYRDRRQGQRHRVREGVDPMGGFRTRARAWPSRRADQAAVRARTQAATRRRDRRRRRRRADRGDRSRAGDGLRCPGHRPDDPSPPHADRDGDVRRRDGRGHDHGPPPSPEAGRKSSSSRLTSSGASSCIQCPAPSIRS